MANKNNVMKILSAFSLAALLTSSCASISTSDTGSELYSEEMTITAIYATSETCYAYGNDNRELGSGTPDSIAYQVGTETNFIVTCGDLSAIAQVGDETVTLTAESTAAADLLSGCSMSGGTNLVAQLISDLSTNLDSVSLNGYFTTTSSYESSPVFAGSVVADGLVTFINALDNLEKDSDDEERKLDLILLLTAMGQPVILENVGEGQILTSCDDVQAQNTFGNYLTATDASVIAMTGCLIYHKLDAITNWNDPLNTPANNTPDSFRSIITESGILTTLLDSLENEKSFSSSSVWDYLFNQVGFTGYQEDGSGTIYTVEITEEDVLSTLNQFLALNLDKWDIASEKFHTNYNPSGGPTYDVVSEEWGAISWNETCYDWTAATLSDCPISPLRFDFDGTTATLNESGEYQLRMEWRGGDFQDLAYVVNASTSKPYRNELYHPSKVSLIELGYNATEVNHIYAENLLHDSSLNSMEDSSGNSAPFSYDSWKDLFPDMNDIDNSFVYPNPEVTARLAILLNHVKNHHSLNALQAFAYSQLLTKGMAAIPKTGSSYTLLNDHNLTLTEWESTTNTWLKSGSAKTSLSGSGQIQIEDGEIDLDIKSECALANNSKVDCDLNSSDLQVDSESATTLENGSMQFTVTGSFTFKSEDFAEQSFSPTALVISASDNQASFTGEDNLELSFTGSKISSKISSGDKLKQTFTISAMIE